MGRILDVHAKLSPAPGHAAPGGPVAPGAAFRAGDVATLAIHATVEGSGRLKWPSRDELQAILGQQASVLSDGQAMRADDALGGGRPEARGWQIQILLPPGEGSIGPIPLTLVGTDDGGEEIDAAEVPAASLVMETVLEPELAEQLDQQQAATDLKAEVTRHLSAPRGPWAVQSRWPLGMIAAALALLALIVLLARWWRRRPRPAAPPIPLEAAEIVARRRLAALEASGLLGRGEHLPFHVELADILKQYLSRRLGTDITELTTDEVRRMMRGEIRVQAAMALGATVRAGEVRSLILHVLTACDVVKFARHAPPPAASLELHACVSRIVDLTTTILPAPDAAAGALPRPVQATSPAPGATASPGAR